MAQINHQWWIAAKQGALRSSGQVIQAFHFQKLTGEARFGEIVALVFSVEGYEETL